MQIKAVIFDMDGLLLDTETPSMQAFFLTCEHFGITTNFDFYKTLIGLNAKMGCARLAAFLQGKAPLADFQTRWQSRYHAMLTQNIPIKPGVEPLLEHLHNCNIPCAVATSTQSDQAHAYLKQAGLNAYFKTLIGGDQVDQGKPNPEVYLKAAHALQTPPQQCLAFEDSENGTRAAVAAGMIVVQIPDLIPPTAELRTLNHHIAPNILQGAAAFGLAP